MAKTKARLMKDPGLSPFSINVDTHHGVVTLFGKVESEAVRKQAEAEARKIEGVRAVQNQLHVQPSGRGG
jgi:hyperosmotically inducible protein